MASHNRFKQPLARDSLIVVILTLAILILSGVIGVSTVSLIRSFGYEYTASSFGKLTKLALILFSSTFKFSFLVYIFDDNKLISTFRNIREIWVPTSNAGRT